jgi:peptidoglycan/LPS O-acetylase OafA/YrhL
MLQEVLLTLLIISALYFSVKIANVFVKLTIENVKYPAIDGVRGYLGFFVFLHHAYIWNHYLKYHVWENPKSNFFNHLGQTSVALFFIITSFLFTTKLLQTKKTAFNWKKYILSRFYRLTPIYLFTISIFLIIVGTLTNFEMRDTFQNNIKNSLSWIFFSISGPVNINLLADTSKINAGVTWTLPYEWMFYLLLPIIGLFYKVKVDLKILIVFTILFILIFHLNNSVLENFIPFIGGIVCAMVLNNPKIKINWSHYKFAILGIIVLILSVVIFNSGKKIIPVVVSTFLLLLIAHGNSFFGILATTFSRKFGQITYSFYLIHGLVLFVLFRFVIGYKIAAQLSELNYWGCIALSLIPIIFISQLTFKYIELPFMHFKNKKTQ